MVPFGRFTIAGIWPHLLYLHMMMLLSSSLLMGHWTISCRHCVPLSPKATAAYLLRPGVFSCRQSHTGNTASVQSRPLLRGPYSRIILLSCKRDVKRPFQRARPVNHLPQASVTSCRPGFPSRYPRPCWAKEAHSQGRVPALSFPF